LTPICPNKIQRTLCIGLGGTGRDILMQIRRLIIDRSGSLDALPVVSFLHIDTDKGAGNLSGLSTGGTYYGENILFTPAERVIATMTSEEVDNLIQELEQRREFDRYSPYNLMGRWLQPNLIDNIRSIEHGTGGIRAAGRLSFFHNYRKIKKAIKTAESRTKGHETTLVKRELTIEPGLNIFLVGSLCGGTGSGIFLDIAYSLRQVYGDADTQLIGYWIISPELYGNTPNMNANTYAALAELDRYSVTNTNFQVCYDPQELACIDSDRPPFDLTYLVADPTNDRNKLFNTIARKIRLDFSNEKSNVVNSCEPKSEQQSVLLNSPNYLMFGLAKIYRPQERIEQIALNQIGLQTILFWLRGQIQSCDPKALLDRFFLECSIDANHRFLPDRLQALVTDSSNRTFSENLEIWSTKIEGEITAVKTAIDRQRVSSRLGSECRDLFFQVSPKSSDRIDSKWIVQIENCQMKLSQIVSKDIFTFLEKLLAPSGVDFSFNNARSWLEAILTDLDRERREIEEFLFVQARLLSIDDLDRKLLTWECRLQDIESQKGLLGLTDKNKQKILCFQSELKQTLADLINEIDRNFNFHLYQAALVTNRELVKFVRSLIAEFSKLNAVLRSVERIYRRKIEELERLNPDDIAGEALFSNNDVEFYKQKLLSEKDEDSTSIEIGEKILLSGFSLKPSLIYLSIEIVDSEVVGESHFTYYPAYHLDDRVMYEQFSSIINKHFTAQIMNSSTGVIQKLLDSYSHDDIQTIIMQLLDRSQPLLPLVKDKHLDRIWETISFSQDIDGYSQKFRDLLSSYMNMNESNFRSIESDREIVIVREQSFSDISQIMSMDRMREHHQNQLD
jgi:Tubulin like